MVSENFNDASVAPLLVSARWILPSVLVLSFTGTQILVFTARTIIVIIQTLVYETLEGRLSRAPSPSETLLGQETDDIRRFFYGLSS